MEKKNEKLYLNVPNFINWCIVITVNVHLPHFSSLILISVTLQKHFLMSLWLNSLARWVRPEVSMQRMFQSELSGQQSLICEIKGSRAWVESAWPLSNGKSAQTQVTHFSGDSEGLNWTSAEWFQLTLMGQKHCQFVDNVLCHWTICHGIPAVSPRSNL